MTEDEYTHLSNRVRVSAAVEILRGVMEKSIPNDGTRHEFIEARRALNRLETSLFERKLVDDQDEG